MNIHWSPLKGDFIEATNLRHWNKNKKCSFQKSQSFAKLIFNHHDSFFFFTEKIPSSRQSTNTAPKIGTHSSTRPPTWTRKGPNNVCSMIWIGLPRNEQNRTGSIEHSIYRSFLWYLMLSHALLSYNISFVLLPDIVRFAPLSKRPWDNMSDIPWII